MNDQIYNDTMYSKYVFEVEIKLHCPDKTILIAKLHEMGANKISVENNHDFYFNHPSRDFKMTDEALRIRTVNKASEITYKGKKIDPDSKTREEITVQVSNMQIMEILNKLDFTIGGEVIKNREIWTYDEIIITLDEVQNLGNYLELEIGTFEENEIKNLVKKLHEIIEKLGYDPKEQIKESYLELIELKNSQSTS